MRVIRIIGFIILIVVLLVNIVILVLVSPVGVKVLPILPTSLQTILQPNAPAVVTTTTVNTQQTPQASTTGCSLNSLSGGYGYAGNGQVVKGGPVAAHGVVKLDGDGHLIGNDVASVNGVITRRSFDGTYSTAADCSGSATYYFDDGTIANFAIQVVKNGSEFQYIETDANIILSGAAAKQ